MPGIILAAVMFAAGVAAGWLYLEGALKAKESDIKALQEEIATLKKSCYALRGQNRALVEKRYYIRAIA